MYNKYLKYLLFFKVCNFLLLYFIDIHYFNFYLIFSLTLKKFPTLFQKQKLTKIDSGKYKCLVRNDFGVTITEPILVNVLIGE